MEYQIRWKSKDERLLKKAVQDFNRKISRLEQEENKLYLPEKLDFQQIKENITTRKELNRQIASLTRFQKEGAEALYTTKAGEQMTLWERKELQKQINIGKRNLNKELAKLSIPKPGQKYSRIQMGSVEAREIEAKLKKLDKLEKERGYDFRSVKRSIKRHGTSDYEMKKAYIYKQNYLKDLEKYSGYDNYDLLMKNIKNLNPITFFDLMSVNDKIVDLTYTSDQVYTQEEFNAFLNMLGIETEDIQTPTWRDELRQNMAEYRALEFQERKEKNKM